jgi:hypothetical protein
VLSPGVVVAVVVVVIVVVVVSSSGEVLKRRRVAASPSCPRSMVRARPRWVARSSKSSMSSALNASTPVPPPLFGEGAVEAARLLLLLLLLLLLPFIDILLIICSTPKMAPVWALGTGTHSTDRVR